jgi:hypothetical protein
MQKELGWAMAVVGAVVPVREEAAVAGSAPAPEGSASVWPVATRRRTNRECPVSS